MHELRQEDHLTKQKDTYAVCVREPSDLALLIGQATRTIEMKGTHGSIDFVNSELR